MVAAVENTQARDMREIMVETFGSAVDRGVELAVVVSDSTSTAKIKPFMELHPSRVINVGIAEQNLVGVAAGLSLGGSVPFTCNAAPFLVSRANEQVKNDVCYSNTNVKLVGLNAGIGYGALGSTHHAIDDVSIMRGFGNIAIVAPADPVEAQCVFEYAIEHEGPMYIRMDSAKLPVLHQSDYTFKLGAVDRLREGTDITICAMGSIVCEAAAAAEALAEQGVSAELLNISSIRPLEGKTILESMARTGRAVTVEEHTLSGGLGSIVAELLMDSGTCVPVTRLGFAAGQFPKAGPRAQMRAASGIDTAGIASAAKALVDSQ